ncbi:MAG: hypothetical protein MZV64_26445 [Ignavibacteriales bacterium]|nr:hypothetical protein [Ignavibacteriales bacterium]
MLSQKPRRLDNGEREENSAPIEIFREIEKLLLELGLIQEYKKIFINKYLNKAVSWLGKVDESYKEEYYKQLSELLTQVKTIILTLMAGGVILIAIKRQLHDFKA